MDLVSNSPRLRFIIVSTKPKDLDALLPLIPSDSLLFESDYHAAGEFMDELNIKVLDEASKCLGKSVLGLSKEVESNFLTFIQSYSQKS